MALNVRRWTIILGNVGAVFLSLALHDSAVWGSQPHSDLEICTGQIGLCSRGVPAMVTEPMRHVWHAAVGADPSEFPSEEDRCSIPGATCSAPAPATIQLIGLDIVADEPVHTAKTFAQILNDWEAASRSLPPVSERDLAWMQRMNAPALSAHGIDLVAEFLGPVDTAKLQREFRWAVEYQGEFGVWLVAVPLDDTVRLFCPKLRIGLTRFSEIAAVSVSDRNGQWTRVSQPAPLERPLLGDMEFDGVPPSPRLATSDQTPLIRFAAGALEIELE